MYVDDDTIVAIASPPTPATRGIVRVTGQDTLRLVNEVTSTQIDCNQSTRFQTSLELPPPLGRLDASLLVWPGCRSYTGSPSAEIHLPGAKPILDATIAACLNAGARLAKPGEFTMRAFLAGRLDLTQAEAVLGVIDAEDQARFDAAIDQLAGGVSRPLRQLRDRLLNAIAHLEAGLDFVEEDIQFITQRELLTIIDGGLDAVSHLRSQVQERRQLVERFQVVLCGEPNAGKSSLINALAGRSVAIESEQAGTTRDTLHADISWNGVCVRLIDTPGWESNSTGLMQIAQSLSNQAAETADLIVYCVDLSRPSITDREQTELARMAESKSAIRVGTQIDRGIRWRPNDQECWIETSSKTGEGIALLRSKIRNFFDNIESSHSEALPSTVMRCQEVIRDATHSLLLAKSLCTESRGEELIAAELRSALTSIGRVTGEVYTDDILDRIFGQFCIGK